MPQRFLNLRPILWLALVLVGAGTWWLSERGDRIPPPVPSAEADSAVVEASDPTAVPTAGTKLIGSHASVPALFAHVTPEGGAGLDLALPAPSEIVRYVRVDRTLASGKASPFWQSAGRGRVAIPLPDGATRIVIIEHSEALGPHRFISQGTIEGEPGSRALFAWNEGYLHASFEIPGQRTVALRVATADLSQCYAIEPARVMPCGGARVPPREAFVAAPGDPVTPPFLLPATLAAENPQRAEVHVMMLYTPAVLSTLAAAERPAAVQSAFDLAIARVNSAFAASLISARVKLVRVAEVAYDESASKPTEVQDNALTALYQENDGKLDEVHALRNAAGADVVCLALERVDTARSGLSFLLDAADDPNNARFAFSVVHYSVVTGTNVVPHEFGHVLGCAHDRENAKSGSGAFSFSFGYRFVGANGVQYRDLMAYEPGDELPYFSNPDVILPPPISSAIGIPAGQPGESNSALTIERTAFHTAGYRLQTQTAAGAGSLINVATRAFVGTDEAVMIGGFFIEGPLPKRMLIRAAGPALRAFGVEDALPDPVLRVMAGATVAAENDNWEQQAGDAGGRATEMMTAAAQVGAFALPRGGADAAVLVTLPPGAYSAVVEGQDGATGHGLVEAYELERSATRIGNLATRGFAGSAGKEMVGGFVVDGEAAATKRILIRVLGPSLARPPFNLPGTLDDPQLEIRDAAGARLIFSDDWSGGVEGGASGDSDFRPLVESYGEKQIFATGLAPLNRREPCVLVDLPAGSYTVTVRPFEARSSNPMDDQPAVPGVGIIEVYEIRR